MSQKVSRRNEKGPLRYPNVEFHRSIGTREPSLVRWGVAQSMVIAWVLRISVSAAASASAGAYALMCWLVAP